MSIKSVDGNDVEIVSFWRFDVRILSSQLTQSLPPEEI